MLRKKKTKKSAGSSGSNLELPKLDFKPQVGDKQEQQGVLIACRGLEQYPASVMLAAQAFKARADQILLDFSQQGVSVRFRVDGMWENMPPMDRVTGDGLLVIYKRLCGLNATDRRSRQDGRVVVAFKGDDWFFDIMSQGVPSGERVVVRIEPKKPVLKTLGDLGMREKMQEQMRSLLNTDSGMFLFSSAASHGLPTLWRVGLESADRFVRDFHSIEDEQTGDPELINIAKHTFSAAAGESAMGILKSLLLKQPDVLVFPDLIDGEIVKLLTEEVLEEKRYAITRVTAGSAVEGWLRLIASYQANAKQLIQMTCGVINQRLIRRLCTNCRQPFQPSPQLLKKLGIPPGRVQVLYQPFIPPPPEQRVDANGKPIEIEICPKCNGRGYYGRAAIFELLQVNDAIRQAMLNKPNADYVVSVARQQGFLTMQEEGVLAVATGLTSLQELQRVLSPPKKG